jgi:hypothetical protein
MTSSEILLIAVGTGLFALYGPKLYLPAIVRVVLLARFRGRVQALIAATAFSLVSTTLMAVLANAQATKRWLAAAPQNIEEAITSIDRVIRDSRGADETMRHIRALSRRETFEKKEAGLFEIRNETVRMV